MPPSSTASRVQQLIPLLSPLQPFDPLPVHLLGYLFVPLLFLLGSSPVADGLDSFLRSGLAVEFAMLSVGKRCAHLSLGLLLLLHLLLLGLHRRLRDPIFQPSRVRGQARGGPEGFPRRVPLFACEASGFSACCAGTPVCRS